MKSEKNVKYVFSNTDDVYGVCVYVCVPVGFSVATYEHHVASTFLPVVDAARQVIVTTGYVAVVVLTAMFAFHVAGWTVCRCLRLRLVVPAADDGPRQPPGRQRPGISTDSSVQTFIRHRAIAVGFCDDYEEDDDDDASDYDETDSTRFESTIVRRRGVASTVQALRPYDLSPLTSSSGGATAAAMSACSPATSAVEFKYSETNV